MLTATAVAVALALALVGCVSPTAQIASLAAPDPAEVLPHLEISETHDHTDRAQHDAAWNMELLGWDPVAPDTSQLGNYSQLAVVGQKVIVSAVALYAEGPPGIAIYNLSGADPVLTATLETPDLDLIDVHATPDGRYVVVAGHKENRAKLPEQVSTQCTGDPRLKICAPYVPGGVIVIDVSDETAPFVVDTWRAFPSGAHTAKIVEIDGTYRVFIASYGTAYANRFASHVDILRLEAGKLVQESKFFSTRPSDNGETERVFVHDIYVEEHPVTGAMLMWVAYWDGGAVVVDVSDPARPTQIAAWNDFEGAEYGNLHFVRPVGMIGDRYIVYAAPEFESSAHAGESYVLDATDPTAPTLLAKWVLPGNPLNDVHYRFSPHNHDPMGDRIVFAHYHGGVWVLNLSTPETPTVDGYAFPVLPDCDAFANASGSSPAGCGGNALPGYGHSAPDIWAAMWLPDGTIVASDRGTGLYHYRLVSDTPGVPPYEALLG